jgi:hypothetical protein
MYKTTRWLKHADQQALPTSSMDNPSSTYCYIHAIANNNGSMLTSYDWSIQTSLNSVDLLYVTIQWQIRFPGNFICQHWGPRCRVGINPTY